MGAIIIISPTIIPKGLIKIAERKFPCESCITERVVPQEGQGTVVTFFKQTNGKFLTLNFVFVL